MDKIILLILLLFFNNTFSNDEIEIKADQFTYDKNSTRIYATGNVEIIDKFFKSLQFDSILTSDDVLHSKPDPEGLLKICKLVNSTTEETIYVGDTSYDFKTSEKAKIDFVYASWGYGEVENSKYKIKNISELTKIL